MNVGVFHDLDRLRQQVSCLKANAAPATQAAHSAALATYARHLNDATEAAGLGRPVASWVHGGSTQTGVPKNHPDLDRIFTAEYGSLESAPAGMLRKALPEAQVRARAVHRAHIGRALFRGVR